LFLCLQVREWVEKTGIENLGKRLVNSREGKVEFDKPNMNVETLLKCVPLRCAALLTFLCLLTFVIWRCSMHSNCLASGMQTYDRSSPMRNRQFSAYLTSGISFAGTATCWWMSRRM
jgi:hypothetical protein